MSANQSAKRPQRPPTLHNRLPYEQDRAVQRSRRSGLNNRKLVEPGEYVEDTTDKYEPTFWREWDEYFAAAGLTTAQRIAITGRMAGRRGTR